MAARRPHHVLQAATAACAAVATFASSPSTSSRGCMSVVSCAPTTTTAAAAATTAMISTPSVGGVSSIPRKPLRYLSKTPFTSSSSSTTMSLEETENKKNSTPFRLDLTELGKKVQESEDRRGSAFDLSRKIQIALVKAQVAMETKDSEEEEEKLEKELDDLVKALMDSTLSSNKKEGDADDEKEDARGSGSKSGGGNRAPREANLSYRIEEFARHKAYRHFLLDEGRGGKLLPPSAIPLVTDEEYLAGACIGLSQDLARYGVGRATVRDVASVKLARDLVRDIMDQLLLFDFRNGPLRRKYDGTKYALKTLETVLYELSVTGATLDDGYDGKDAVDGPNVKRVKIDSASTTNSAMEVEETESSERVPVSELSSLRGRMERRDEMREALIKRCRDGQKAAKQAIFALHRGDNARSLKLLRQCHGCITNDLLPIIEEEPGLRYGSFANVLEEYVEGQMFYAWLHGLEEEEEEQDDSEKAADSNRLSNRPRGRMLQPEDFHPIYLEPDEYIGGLCDLTGEIGRYAVQRGMERDAAGVRLCLETNKFIMMAIQTMERTPGGTGKKMGALEQSIKKLEKMLYELSLVEATGRNVATEVKEIVEEEENQDKEY